MNSVRPNARTQQRNNVRSSVHSVVPKPAVLERCARAVAEASGYRFTGKSIITSAETNPRSSHFVAVATAVLTEAQTKGAS